MNATQTALVEAHRAGTCTDGRTCNCSTLIAAADTPATDHRVTRCLDCSTRTTVVVHPTGEACPWATCDTRRPGAAGARLCVLKPGHDGDHDGGGPRCTWPQA